MGDDASLSGPVLLSLLPFEVKVMRQEDDDNDKRNRKLMHIINDNTWKRRILRWWKNGSISNDTALQSYRRQSTDPLGPAVQSFLQTFYLNELERRSSQTGVKYSPLEQIVISPLKKNNSRRRLSDISNKIDGDKDRLLTDNLFVNYELLDSFELVPSQNLRKTAITYTMDSTQYNGVAIFRREGTLAVPSDNLIQTLQLQSFSDINSITTNLQKSSGYETVTAVSANVLKLEDLNGSSVQPESPPKSGGFNTIILVSVIIAGTSMILLAIALFLAFRRKQNYVKATSHNRLHVTQAYPHQPHHPLGPDDEDEVYNYQMKTFRGQSGETERITPDNSAALTPPVIETHDHEDTISDYTESVFSTSMTNVKSPTEGDREKVAAWLETKKRAGSPAVTGSNQPESKASSRFQPRFLRTKSSMTAPTNNQSPPENKEKNASLNDVSTPIHSTVNENQFDPLQPLTDMSLAGSQSSSLQTSSIRDGSEDNDDLSTLGPYSITEMIQQRKGSFSSKNSVGSRQSSKKEGKHESILYPDSIMDEDIQSSLYAYESRQNNLKGNARKEGDDNDGDASYISVDSYGFSLDGATAYGDTSTVGGTSTVADTPTKSKE
mmetsp:Transcript_2586/g.3656  ORF Transcript_2586/g.3656 Transcript_2586/m.3656 type:complete len:608 (-) Transcript_2586:370-2193(-)|eukprot:CAMPEP_0184865616 /NCGR_PEP_ID=MMETSP0580-20130426/18659_1 /TAXON_ID=1118495 /ORGANISM="Dactyliosolen fragilissimus" /LENGTH=607 /DNA_ID=CAMNT_0027364893 /DNA_START=54 /DNA_END=1877 /DNA_ORIENTATION=-